MKKVFTGTFVVLIILVILGSYLDARSPQQPASVANTKSPTPKVREASRLNNLGAAYMNQQAFEKGLKYFQEAYAADPNLYPARLNQGIALLNLQKVAEASPILQEAVKRDPKNARAWYNIGLLHKSSGDAPQALDAFKRAVELAPNDPDAHYFLGLAYSQTGDNKSAAAEFQKALELFPFHASAEFGLARAYQKLEQPEQARTHLGRFQHLTQAKLGTPITLAYGEQGPLSLVVTVGSALQDAPQPIAVKFTDATQASGIAGNPAATQANALTGAGACVID